MDYRTPGSLVHVRNRDWIVLPSADENLVIIKPLGGSEDEITAIYLPLALDSDKIKDTQFPLPSVNDIGDTSSARLLYDAARLSFRNCAGPFRCMGKLSFRPRSYQMVPLIMALKLKPIRLLIADDVGIGKTIEALMIVKELLERGDIKRFAIICLPHLCDQWQSELREKFNIDAVIIRSNTQGRLDREIFGDTSVYEFYPFQIISVDYIKSEQRRQVFIQQCPELIIVDEAHTCVKPAGANKSQQQRYHLLHDLSRKDDTHLIMLTATPHSGKSEEFQSLIGLLKPEFETRDLPKADKKERIEIARHFVQRRRGDVLKWLNEDTPFPKRDSGEFNYELSVNYKKLYHELLEFARELIRGDGKNENKKRMRYWSALALLRGAMSSPAAGIEMLKNRLDKPEFDELEISEDNPIIEVNYGFEGDYTHSDILSLTEWTKNQKTMLNGFILKFEELQSLTEDTKAGNTEKIILDWLDEGYNPVIFCRYIATANYLGKIIQKNLKKKFKDLDVQVITSEDPDDVRKGRIDLMGESPRRLLVATDCLSEGINLQEHFDAVLHYDLPWNPNRLEQREGRVDRYGQSKELVKAYLIYSKDNPIDGIVLKVLLRKVREIRKDVGIAIPFPEDSKTMMDAVLNAVIFKPELADDEGSVQLTFDYGETDPVMLKAAEATKEIEKAANRESETRSIFAQHGIKASEIEVDLKEVDVAIGNPGDVEGFVVESCRNLMNVQMDKSSKGYLLFTSNLPDSLKSYLPNGDKLKISFISPTPEGYTYIGRNNLFVEEMCRYLLNNALLSEQKIKPARASVIRSKDVKIKTTVMLLRARNVIKSRVKHNQVIAEEMIAWGYRGNPEDKDFISDIDAAALLFKVKSSENMSVESQQSFLENEVELTGKLKSELDAVALERTNRFVEANERFRKAAGGENYEAVVPVLPMDIMGIYIILPGQL